MSSFLLFSQAAPMVQRGEAAGQARPNRPKEQKSVSHEAPALPAE
jgi:hypothetical protein